MKRTVVAGLVLILLVFLGMALRPINTDHDNRKTVNGVLANIHDGPSGDIVFSLEADRVHYYINRGLEQGLITQDLKEQLLGQKITIEYADHWTPLDPANSGEHMTGLLLKEVSIYKEE